MAKLIDPISVIKNNTDTKDNCICKLDALFYEEQYNGLISNTDL